MEALYLGGGCLARNQFTLACSSTVLSLCFCSAFVSPDSLFFVIFSYIHVHTYFVKYRLCIDHRCCPQKRCYFIVPSLNSTSSHRVVPYLNRCWFVLTQDSLDSIDSPNNATCTNAGVRRDGACRAAPVGTRGAGGASVSPTAIGFRTGGLRRGAMLVLVAPGLPLVSVEL